MKTNEISHKTKKGKILKMKNIKILLGLLVLGVIAFVACTTNNTENADNIVEEEIPVSVISIERKDIENIQTYSAKVEAEQDISVIPRAMGKVEKIYYQLGDKVKKDTVLFKIEEDDLKNTVNALKAQLDAANVNIEMARAGLQSSKGSQHTSQITQLESTVNSLKIQLDDLENKYINMGDLYKQGAVSKQEYDAIKNSYEQTQISYNSAKTSYDLYKNQIANETIELSEQRLQQAIASKNALEAQLASAKDALNNTNVKSPINGVVAAVNVKEGQQLTGGVAYRIVTTDKLNVKLNVSEAIIGKLSTEMIVDIKIPSIGDEKFQGAISAISPAADISSSTYPIEISLDNIDSKIKPGMFAEVEFEINKKEETLVLPRDSVLEIGTKKYVYVVENDVAVEKEVKTGIDNGREIEITEGLDGSEKVINKGQKYLENNSKVKIIG